MREELVLTLSAALLLAGCSGKSDISIEIGVDAPDDYIRGGVFELGAVYDADGAAERVALDDRVLESGASFVVEVPGHKQWVLQAIEAELRHPKYRPASEIVVANDILMSPTIVLRPQRWTTNDRHTFIQPAYETSVAAAEHLDWIGEVYFQRPEWLLVNEAFQEDHRLVSMLAYGGGSKKGDWEILRLANIERWKDLNETMEERSYRACPPGYQLQGFAHRPCGAEKLNITYYDRGDTESATAAQDELRRQVSHARADLAKRLGIDESAVELGSYDSREYDPVLAYCPDAGAPPEVDDEPGYEIAFVVNDRGLFIYLGKNGELPFYCRSKT